MSDFLDRIAKQPAAPVTTPVAQVVNNTGYDPSAGDRPMEDMPTRSSFDKGLMEGESVNDHREAQQSGWDLAGAYLGRSIGQGAAKILEGFSMLGSAVGAGVLWGVNATGLDKATTGKELDSNDWTMDSIMNNPVNKLFNSFEDGVKNVMPVYHRDDYAQKTESDKFFHNFGEWLADSGSEMTSFALGLLVPSGAVSDIGVGASVIGDASRGATMLGRTLSAMGASEKLLQTTSKAVDLATQYAVHGSIESMFMAKSTGDQVTQEYLNNLNKNLPQGQKPYTDAKDLPDNLKQDLANKSSSAMKNDYFWNLTAGAPAALFEMGLINKFIGKGAKAAIGGIDKEIDAGEAITDEASQVTKQPFNGFGPGKFKTLTKGIASGINSIGGTRVGSVLGALPKSVIIEGMYKTNLQHQLQELSTQYGLEGKSGYFLESGLDAGKEILNSVAPSNWNNPKYQESRDAMFSGAVLGAVMGGVTAGTVEHNQHAQAKFDKQVAVRNAIDYLNSAKSDFLSQDMYVTKNVTNPDGSVDKQIQFDNTGQPIQDNAGMVNFLGNQKRMTDLVGTEEYYAGAGDKQMASIVRDERTTNWALAHLQSGKGDAMFAKLDKLASAQPSDLQKLGFDPTFYDDNGHAVPIAERAEQLRKKASEVKNHYDDISSKIPNEQVGRIEELTRLNSRMDSMNDQVDKLNQQKDDISLEYKNDPDHVKDIDQNVRKLRALEDNHDYIKDRSDELNERIKSFEDNTKGIDEDSLSKEEKNALQATKEGHEFDRAKLNFLSDFHQKNIDDTKAKVDNLKSTYSDQLALNGHDNTVGKYNLLKRSNSKQQTNDITESEKRIEQLNGAIAEHGHEINELMKPYNGAKRYENRLASSFNNQISSATIEANDNKQTELPPSEYDTKQPAPKAAVGTDGKLYTQQQAPVQPETVSTLPEHLQGKDFELPNSNTNQKQTVLDNTITDGKLDTSKLDKFTHDNLGKQLKVTYEGNDAGVYGVIRQGSDGTPKFITQGGKELPITHLLGSGVKSIEVVTKQPAVITKTEQAPTPKESDIVTKDHQKEFDTTMYNSSKPYLAVGLNSTTGIDNHTNVSQERWFRSSENLDLNSGKHQLVTITKANTEAAKKLLGSDWNDDLHYDDNTIKVVLLKDGKPYKADQAGKEDKDGELVYTALRLTPSKDKIQIVEHRNAQDKAKDSLEGYTHQSDKNATFIATRQEATDGTVDKLLQQHKQWRNEVLADPNTRVIDITSKGSGIRVKGELGPVEGKLGKVDVKIAKGDTLSDPSGKPITVKNGLTYAEYKGMVVPLTGRNLSESERPVIKELLKQWSKAESQKTLSFFTRELSEAIDAKNKEKILDYQEKLRGKDLSFLPTDASKLLKAKPESYSADELQKHYDYEQDLAHNTTDYKQYLKDTIRLGDTNEHGIYMDKGSLVFGKESIPQETLWSGDTPSLDEYLKSKYLQTSSRALSTSDKFNEYHLEDGKLQTREWPNYNEYLTASEYPNEDARPDKEIPLKSSLAPSGDAQFNSVNLRFNGFTEATKPARTDTVAFNKVPVEKVRKEMTFPHVAREADAMEEGKTYRVELRYRDRKVGQEPFYIDYKVVDGKKEFVKLIKRDGTESTTEPKSFEIVKSELNDAQGAITTRPDNLHYEYMGIKEAEDATPKDIESVEPSPSQPSTGLSDDTASKVISAFSGDFKGSIADLNDFIATIKESGLDATPEQIAKSYEQANPADIVSKQAQIDSNRPKRPFRGMTADNRISTPIDIDKEEAWFKERFPNVDFQRTNGLIQGKYWGLFDSAAGVLVSTDAIEGTTYHEAFHTASLLYHDEATRQDVYNEYRNRTASNEADSVIEEKLADEFRDFVLSDGKYTFPDKQQSFFRKIWEAIKNLFNGGNKIEDVFSKINNGGYANMEQAKDLGIQTSAPMKADLAETYSKVHATLDDMTVNFFNHFFQDGDNIDTLFNIFSQGKSTIAVDDIYAKMFEDYSDRASENPLLRSLINDPVKWDGNVRLHKQELANLGLKLIDKSTSDNTGSEVNAEHDLEFEGQKDNAQMESFIEFSSKEGMPKIVKFFLSSLPELEYAKDKNGNFIMEKGEKVLQHASSAYFTDKLANPEKLMNTLGNKLAGITDIGDMISTIKTLSDDYPTLTALIKRMQIGDEILPTTATPNEAAFQTMFWQQFAKTIRDQTLTYIADDGRVNLIDSNSETQQNVSKQAWRNNLLQELNSSDSVIKVDDRNRIVIDKNKVEQLRAIEDPFKRASKLGIQFTFPDKIKNDPEMFKQFRENLDAIINSITASKQPVTDLYTREGLNSQNRIGKLSDLEAKTAPDSIERQFIAVDGKTNYSIGQYNALSMAINELNNRKGNYYETIKTNPYSQNSILMDRMEDSSYKVDVLVSGGVKRQTGEAIETGKLTPADAMANTINGILNGQFSILRPGDKKLEYKLKTGEFVPAKGLVYDGKYNAKVSKIFRGYLSDEFNRVLSLRDGLGDNIAEYNKHSRLKDGRIDLGFFNDILKDTKIPEMKSLTDAESWINENKDTIDAKVKDFLEATTNQYGAKARKLSVFKETMEKTGRRSFKPTGQYMINGVSSEDVNKVLGRDVDSDRYTKNDIHQFFRYITINQLIANIEQTKTTIGAMEFYKDPLKRFASLTGTKKMTRVDPDYENWAKANMEKIGYINGKKISLPQDGKVRIATVGDIISNSPKEVLDNFKEGLKANGLSNDEVSKVLTKFKNINEADAQSWIHLPAYREFLHRTGDWTSAHEEAYSKAIRGEALTSKDIFLFPPLKPLAYGPQDAGGLYSPLLVKTSLSPLIPSVIKGTDLETLMHKMYKDGTDIVSPSSAVKVGAKIDKATNDYYPMYVRDGDNAVINPKSFNEVGVDGNDSVVSTLPYQYMGIQLDVAPKRKTDTTRGTQHEKLIMSNIKNIEGHEQIVADYKKAITSLVENAKQKLFENTGIKSKGDNYIIPDRTKLLNYLQDQAIKRDAPTNLLVGLNKALAGDSTLDAVVNKDRIDSILSSLITNGVIKGTRNGEQRIQVASTGYGKRVYDKESGNLQTSDKLKSYVYDPKGTKPMEIMTALPKALVPFVEKMGGLVKFNQMINDGKIDERILKGVGFRIPTQQLSSMVYYRVKEFLPYESGPVVVLPSMITSIAGSDFDIDKLSLYEKNYNINYAKGDIKDDFRPMLRKELYNQGLLDQFNTTMGKMPEALTDEEIGNLVQYSKDSISDEEGDKMDDVILDMQKKYTTRPELQYIEPGDNSEKALQNRLLEINEQVMSHPSNFKNLIAPIGNEVLSGQADKMVDLRAKAVKGEFNAFEDTEQNSYPSTNLMNMDYLMEQGQRFQSGKGMLGIAAKQNTHHVLSQMEDLTLKPDTKVWFKEAKDVHLGLNNIMDLDDKHQVSDVISEFINGFVDIVKDQFTYDLNATPDTINPFFYLTRVGVPIESVTSFLNQPVIRKYIDERNKYNSLIAKGLPEAYRKSNYNIIDGLRAELVSIAKKDSTLYAKYKPFDSRMPHYYEDTDAREKVRATYKNYSTKALDDMILDPNKPTNAVGQLQVLDQFLQYQKDSNQLTDLMQLNSSDTDGVKGSLARSFVQKAMYREFMNDHSTIFENPSKVVQGIIKPYHDVVEEAESYFSPLFDTKSEQSNQLRNELVHQVKSLGIDDATDIIKKFENHLVMHLLHNVTTDNFPNSLGDEAIKSKGKKVGDNIEVQPALLTGMDSSVNALMKLRKNMDYPNDFVNSLFATRGIDRTQGNYVDNVRLFNKRINKQQTDILSGAASDLLNDNPSLAKRIFRTTLVQSGLNNSYMSYHNVLPAEWFHNFVSSIMRSYREGDVPVHNVIDDYYRNNWKNDDLVPSVERRVIQATNTPDVVSMSVNNPQYADKLYIKKWDFPTENGVKMDRNTFFKLRKDESLDPTDRPNWELYLYKHYDQEGDNVLFKRVNPLGLSERYQETSTDWKNESAMNQNNKVQGDYVSSEEYNNFTGYKPDLGKLDPSNIPVGDELKERFRVAAGDKFESTHEAIAAQDKVDNAIKLYQQKVSEGMDEKQAADRAEKEITCL